MAPESDEFAGLTGFALIDFHERCGFIRTDAGPRRHEEEDNRPYLIMEMRVSPSPT